MSQNQQGWIWRIYIYFCGVMCACVHMCVCVPLPLILKMSLIWKPLMFKETSETLVKVVAENG